MKIINARVFIDGRFHDTEVSFNEKEIISIGKVLSNDEVIDAKGVYLYPGFIDCHNHGGWMRDFMYAEGGELGSYQERIQFITENLPSVGVTTVYPTLSGTNYPLLAKSTRELRKIRSSCTGARISDFQFEGVYPSLQRYMASEAVNPSRQHTDWLVDGDYSDVSMFHVSPDLPGTMEWCDYLVEKGVMPTVGNTQASAEDVIKAADHGLCQADHMYNGYEAMHHRKSGAAVGVLLDDRIKAQITCDGHHVEANWIRLLIKCKGIENVYGVTDMSSASGLPDGRHVMENGKVITVKNDVIYGEDGYFNSGNASMNVILKAARDKCRLTMEEVGTLYGENVARCIGICDRGKIEAGRLPDFTIMSKDYEVLMTFIGGKIVYQK